MEAVDFGVLARLREQTFDGDTDLVPELIEIFLEVVPRDCKSLGERVAAADPDQMARDAHRLRSSTANLGATHMSELCTRLEVLGNEGHLSGADAMVGELIDELGRVRSALEHYLQSCRSEHDAS